MKKILELNAEDIYRQTGLFAFVSRRSIKEAEKTLGWKETVFSPAQLKFLEKHQMVLRPHPRRYYKIIEVFIDESTMKEYDWTILNVLFLKFRQ